jgi:hypothetical protein
MKTFFHKHLSALAILLWVLFVLATAPAQAAPKLPNDAPAYVPVLVGEIDTYWADMQYREFLAGLVEQESNWKIGATLKHEREFGCGLGQFTKTFNKDGSIRFDTLTETKRLDKSLAGWNWDDCYNAKFQLRAMLLKIKTNERSCKVWMDDSLDIKRCDGSAYNGGLGGYSKRMRLCRATAGCDARKWEGHLELQCAASNTKVAGYGESFCQINSKYPGRILTRMEKYKPYMIRKP